MVLRIHRGGLRLGSRPGYPHPGHIDTHRAPRGYLPIGVDGAGRVARSIDSSADRRSLSEAYASIWGRSQSFSRGEIPALDTIVIAVGMPFCLAFLDQPVDEVVALWESWVESGELVQARHEDPARDAVIRLRPSVLGVAEFIPNEPAGRLFGDRMLWSLPALMSLPDASDSSPQHSHFWTLQMNGFTARPEVSDNGSTGLILGGWDFGRL